MGVLEVTNPATGCVIGSAPARTSSFLDATVAAAQSSFGPWSQDPKMRTEAMLACAARIKEHAEELGGILTSEMGKPIGQAVEEAFIAGVLFEVNATLPLEPEVVSSAPSRVVVYRRPLGVVGAIGPWNWPLGLSMWKVAPALRAGNTVILKPSPFTPLSSMRLGELVQNLLPDGVFTVVTGGDDLGRRLVEHPNVRKIGFTGSVPTGLAIAQSCAADLKRVTLELGGNDAAIVLSDADIDAIAEPIFWGAFANAGQICSAIKRVYVAREQHDALVTALAARAQRTVIGDPTDPTTELGPVGNQRQLARIQALVQDAKDRGATIVCGGEALAGPGYFYPPTIVTDVDDAAPLVRDEQFGPVLPVLPFDDVDEALARANATNYGLGGSIWTRDTERGARLAGRLEVGTAWVNQHFVLDAPTPFGGWKHSGIGRENGLAGLHAYTELQVISVAGAGG
jgi:acyl-CoA reductase-like NAD-dependent aldehyde dehydrogenase